MATKTLRPRLLQTSRNPNLSQRRNFLPNPFAASTSPLNPPIQTLSARRVLPYPPLPIYAIIADVSSYSAFLPYCTSSTVTSWSAPDAKFQRRWPSEGEITVGWGGVNETFTSRIFCVPGRIVESVGGQTETALQRGEIGHHLQGNGRHEDREELGYGLLTHLRSRWTVNPVPRAGAAGTEQTEVALSLEFAFANPMYTMASAAAKPMVADKMISAFEKRLREQLNGRTDLAEASLADFGGSLPA